MEASHGVTRVQGGCLAAASRALDAGNSGTTMRLLAGILAGQTFDSCIDGDGSLRRRPMGRIVKPLRLMGADIQDNGGYPPLTMRAAGLQAVSYRLPVASAQVKSCLLLAGLFAVGTTSVVEPVPSRDHTERMFAATGIEIEESTEALDRVVSVAGGQRPHAFSLEVPGDISSAAFLFAAAALTGSSVTVRGIGVNETRTGFLGVLERMGCELQIRNRRLSTGEPVADVQVSGDIRQPLTVDASEVPRLIDELPLVALLASAAEGETTVSGAGELRVKESDRIASVATELARMGVSVEERSDGFRVRGPQGLRGAHCTAGGDHRMAMLLAVAGLAASGTTTVEGAEAADVSFPGFAATMSGLGGAIAED